MVSNERAGVCQHSKCLLAKPVAPMMGHECREKKERMSVIVRAETEEINGILQNEVTKLNIAVLWTEHIFDASLHI
ncbi:hypothetical protein [Pseudomonas sp. TMP25]|uniref:hypothetical protein n=1 Tax=Pseudomonas sp. TMP25 TaxID=3136561 RepID=UPI0031016794